MKVLIISHESDIDGMGSVVLGKLAFDEVDYILSDTPKLPDVIQELYDNNRIHEYDMIYVTDMWLSDPWLTKIANDRELNGKFYVFDHHKSAIEESFDRYPFTKIKIADELGKCCGTSIFYGYLQSNNYLEKNKGIYQFVELTRKYDTWEWKTRYNDNEANELNILFNILGTEDYISRMYSKLKDNPNNFNLDENEKFAIKYKEKQINEQVAIYAKNIYERKIMNYNAGIVFVPSEYRNDITQYLRDNNSPLDFVMLVCLENRRISYRNIKPNVNVRLIAELYGGKGHDFAAASNILEKDVDKIVDILTTQA